ncbi:uncharacterized protein METZ01_LOCUS220086, partial [marine metagenome]
MGLEVGCPWSHGWQGRGAWLVVLSERSDSGSVDFECGWHPLLEIG